MIGISLHSRSRRVTSTPSPSGSTRSTIAASGGRIAARSSASSAVSAGIASKPASRSTTRSARRICGSSSTTSTRVTRAPRRRRGSGSSTTNEVPWPGSDSTRTCPPLASTQPAHDRQAEPRALAGRAGPAVERREDALLLGERDARALVDHAHQDPAAAHPRAHRHRLVVAVAQRVLDQVRERAPQLAGVGAHQRQVGARSTAAPRSRRAGVLDRGADHLLERAPVLARLGGARLQPREVEQLVDEPRQPPALVRDRVGQLEPVLGVEATARRAPRRRRRSPSAASAGRARPTAGRRS